MGITRDSIRVQIDWFSGDEWGGSGREVSLSVLSERSYNKLYVITRRRRSSDQHFIYKFKLSKMFQVNKGQKLEEISLHT